VGEEEGVIPQLPCFCAELQLLLDGELAHGNSIKEGPSRGWPEPDGVFLALRDNSARAGRDLPEGVEHSINVDPHYDWHEDYFCHKHRHALVCGSPGRLRAT